MHFQKKAQHSFLPHFGLQGKLVSHVWHFNPIKCYGCVSQFHIQLVTFYNTNFTVWAVWAARAVMKFFSYFHGQNKLEFSLFCSVHIKKLTIKGQLISKYLIWCHHLDQNSDENTVWISALKFFIASLGLPGSFFRLPVGFLIYDIIW